MVEIVGAEQAVVVGGSKGIGRVIAKAMIEAGYSVTVTGRSAEALKGISAVMHVASSSFDVSDESAVFAAFKKLGTVSVLVNCAGQASSAPFLKHDSILWNRMLDVNLRGVFNCTRAVLPGMLERNAGRIINIASTAGLRGYSYVAAYVAAKHGVVGLTRALAQEFAKTEITFNAICPGYTRTDIFEETVSNAMAKTGRERNDVEKSLLAQNPQGRVIEPEEIAAVVLWLCSFAARSVTGQSIVVAGGEVV